MDARIILAGQPLDVAGAIGAGNQLAMQTNQLRDQNALRDVYRTQGAGIMQGDQRALNALAMIDPAQAMGIQGQRLDMQATQQRMDMLTREEQRQIAAFKAQASAAEAAAAAERLENGVKAGLAARTPEEFDAIVTQFGAPELVGQFNMREAFARRALSMAEALKANQGPELPDSIVALEYRAQQAGLQKGTPEYADFMERGGSTPTPPASVEIKLPGQDKLDDEFAKLDAQNLNQVAVAGQAAIRNIGRIDRLGQLLQSGGSGAGAALQRLAGEIGINLGEGTSDIQAAQAIINSLVPEQRQPGSGPMSDADLALFKQSLPRIINQPGGNAVILQTMRGIAEYDAEGARIVQQYRSGQINRAQAFEALQNRKNPLDGFTAPTPETPATPEAATAAPEASGEIPQTFMANPSAKAAAERSGVTIEELWQYLSPETRARLSQ